MFMILPVRDDSPPAATEEPPEETRTRVKKACDRCRIKKTKCNGRIPCARCERDRVACRAVLSLGKSKELSRNYIASLEEQQLSLLGALRELHRQAPGDTAILDTMKRLEARGFDVGTLKSQDQTVQVNASTRKGDGIPTETAEPISWDYSGFTIDNLEALLTQPAACEVASDFLWDFGDATTQQGLQQDLEPNAQQDMDQSVQDDAFFNVASPDNEALMESFLASPTNFTLSPRANNYTTEESESALGCSGALY